MIDRLLQHAAILALKGDSYRLKDRDSSAPPPPNEPPAAGPDCRVAGTVARPGSRRTVLALFARGSAG